MLEIRSLLMFVLGLASAHFLEITTISQGIVLGVSLVAAYVIGFAGGTRRRVR